MKIESGRIVTLAVGFIALFTLTLGGAIPPEQWGEPPDLVLQPLVPNLIQAGTAQHTHRFELPSGQAKDQWIRAIDFRPGDPRIVQRAFFYIEKTGQWLGAWVPGQKMVPFPDTVAAILPAGSKIIIEIRYQSVDQDVRDTSALALYFTDKKPLRPLSGMGVNTKVVVPASQSLFTLRKDFTVINDCYALALRPQMLAAGRSVEITSLDPAGASQVLLGVRNFNKDVQPPYVFEEPLFIPKGTRIVAMASYQNFDVAPVEDVFKLTISMYPSGEVRPVVVDDAAKAKKSSVRRSAGRKPAPSKKTPAKKAPKKKTPTKKR